MRSDLAWYIVVCTLRNGCRRNRSCHNELATKGDIQDVRNEIQDVRSELKAETADTRHEILWILGMMVAQTTLIITTIGAGVALLHS